jgi:hypothetical protein
MASSNEGSLPAINPIKNMTPTAIATITSGMRKSRTMSFTEGGSIGSALGRAGPVCASFRTSEGIGRSLMCDLIFGIGPEDVNLTLGESDDSTRRYVPGELCEADVGKLIGN